MYNTRVKLTALKASAIATAEGLDFAPRTNMKSEDRKAAIAAYKERKTVAGIYVVRCGVSGRAWVGQTPNLDTIQNRIWFALRMGSHTNRDLQRAWSAHGGDDFTFEAVERLKEENLPYVRDQLLKERAAHWRSILNGAVI
jgi:hypothetical protein